MSTIASAEDMRINAEQRGAGETVAARLRRSGYPFLWGVTCTCSAGEVVLSGIVPTFYLKQVAQELARRTAGVIRVDNRLQVTGSVNPTTVRRGTCSEVGSVDQYGDVADKTLDRLVAMQATVSSNTVEKVPEEAF